MMWEAPKVHYIEPMQYFRILAGGFEADPQANFTEIARGVEKAAEGSTPLTPSNSITDHRELPATHTTLYPQVQMHIWNIYIRNFQQQSPTVYWLLNISPTPKVCQTVMLVSIPRPGTEPGPLVSEVRQLLLGHLI